MIYTDLVHEHLIIDSLKLEIGDLVMTILGDYGVVVGYGKHPANSSDKTDYYRILIDDNIYHYLSHALMRVEKE